MAFTTNIAESNFRYTQVDHDGASTVWNDLFATDQDAYEEFERTIKMEGIRTFLDRAASNNRH